jgi:hypothetical protein
LKGKGESSGDESDLRCGLKERHNDSVYESRQRLVQAMRKRHPESDQETIKLEDGMRIGSRRRCFKTVVYRIKELPPNVLHTLLSINSSGFIPRGSLAAVSGGILKMGGPLLSYKLVEVTRACHPRSHALSFASCASGLALRTRLVDDASFAVIQCDPLPALICRALIPVQKTKAMVSVAFEEAASCPLCLHKEISAR